MMVKSKKVVCLLFLCCILLSATPGNVYAGDMVMEPYARNLKVELVFGEIIDGTVSGVSEFVQEIDCLLVSFDEMEIYNYDEYTINFEFEYLVQNLDHMEQVDTYTWTGFLPEPYTDITVFSTSMSASSLKSGLLDGIKSFFGFSDKRYTCKFDWEELISECPLYEQGYAVVVQKIRIWFCKTDEPGVTGYVANLCFEWNDSLIYPKCIGIRYELEDTLTGEVVDKTEQSGSSFSLSGWSLFDTFLAFVNNVLLELPGAVMAVIYGIGGLLNYLVKFLVALFPFLPVYVLTLFVVLVLFGFLLFLWRMFKK